MANPLTSKAAMELGGQEPKQDDPIEPPEQTHAVLSALKEKLGAQTQMFLPKVST